MVLCPPPKSEMSPEGDMSPQLNLLYWTIWGKFTERFVKPSRKRFSSTRFDWDDPIDRHFHLFGNKNQHTSLDRYSQIQMSNSYLSKREMFLPDKGIHQAKRLYYVKSTKFTMLKAFTMLRLFTILRIFNMVKIFIMIFTFVETRVTVMMSSSWCLYHIKYSACWVTLPWY